MRRQSAFQELGASILPDGSRRQQTRLGSALYDAASKSESARDYWNSPQANEGRYDTDYDGYDVGSYVRRSRNLFGDDNFKAGRANINAPSGLGESTGMAPLQG
ncbi:MAG: hypothetical protein KDA46_03555, partial [Parvularculaceae bacterium]|nr:hypothetical protein [Parvularculaceae bacterium]